MGSVHLRSVLCIVLCLFGTACSKQKEEYTPQSDDEVPGKFTRFVRVRPDSTRVLLDDDDRPLDFELTGQPLNLTVAVNLTRKCETYDLMTFKIEDGRENDTDKQFGLHVLWRISESKFEVHQSDRLATTTKLEVGWPESDTIYLMIENPNVTAYNGSVSKSAEMCLVSHNETCSFTRTHGRMSLAFTTTNDIDCGMYVDIPKRAAIWKVPETDRPTPTTAATLVTADRRSSLVTNNDAAANTSNTSEKSTAVSATPTTPHPRVNGEHEHGSDDHLAVIIVLSVIAFVLLVCVVLLVILLLRTRRKQNKSKRDRRTKNATANDSTRLLQSVDQTTLTTMSQVTEGSKSATDPSKKRTDPAPKEASKKSSSKKEASEVKTKKTKSLSQKDVNQNNEVRRPSKDPLDSNMQPNPSVDVTDDVAPPNKMASREVSKTVADSSDYKTVPSAKDKP
ncbi:hypothetical protein AAVH_02287 [Aphelenchoides avenae]|nr:hypothetical protein AAVH_02287 [Aphelenchus avenae]